MDKPHIDLTGAKVLLVDDTPDNLRLLRGALEPEGYSILLATSGEGALRIAASAHPDLILLDVQMPGMDGFETCRRLKEKPGSQDVPVIFVTARAETESVVAGFRAGGVDYIVKPFQNEEVLVRVQTHLKIDRLARELQESNRALREAQNQLVLKEKLASLGKLVAGIAHEINNPIGAVNSAADVVGRCTGMLTALLDRGTSPREDAQVQKVLQVLKDNSRIMVTAGERIARVVSDLKIFARLDKAVFQKADLHEGLDSTLALCEHGFRDRVTVVKEYGEIPAVQCYPGELNQVFMNLLLNAAEAIKTRGTIRIETFSDQKSVFVRISDTGVGIPAEDLHEIFSPGFTTKGVGVGIGLGLPISYDIVQKHGGEIQVESEPGVGSVFTVRIPVLFGQTRKTQA